MRRGWSSEGRRLRFSSAAIPGNGESFELLMRGSLGLARGKKLTGEGAPESWCWIRRLLAWSACSSFLKAGDLGAYARGGVSLPNLGSGAGDTPRWEYWLCRLCWLCEFDASDCRRLPNAPSRGLRGGVSLFVIEILGLTAENTARPILEMLLVFLCLLWSEGST